MYLLIEAGKKVDIKSFSPMWSIVMMIICSLWFLSEVLVNILTRSKKSDSDSHDHNSLGLIWIAIVLSITAGVFIGFRFPGFNECAYFSGLALIIVGITVRIIAIVSLKSLFNANVAIHHDHKLKTDGIYKKIRHPSYSGSLLSFLGLGLTMGNWISLLVIFLPVLAAFLFRISIEEKVLMDNFKDEYLNYKKGTKKLIPYVY
jgi:protein-S-isoprenylcysteine O-methyltransferase Ste14